MLLRLHVSCLLCGLGGVVLLAQDPRQPDILSVINQIKAVDHHSHALPAPGPAAAAGSAADALGTSPLFFQVRQRESNPEWAEAWRALYGEDQIDAAVAAKERVRADKGDAYPSWVLDQAGIEIAFVNAPTLGRGQTGPRFRWVPYADGLLFPFPLMTLSLSPPPARRAEVGLTTAPPAWDEYLTLIDRRLQDWKGKGAVAIKFAIAYYRPLDVTRVAESDAKQIYERFFEEGGAQPRDYRTAEYKMLQDFLFRQVARQAGRAGLAVHIHTGEGAGPVFPVAGSNPLLLESVLNDFSLSQTTFVLVHGGAPFDREVSALLQKPNVYADISGRTFFHSRRDVSDTLRLWLWSFPEKVFFGTDAFTNTRLRGWEEMTWLATRSGREALAMALTQMVTDGDVSRPRAEDLARMVLRDNAVKLYKLR
jgi:uncharacterized protein